MGEHLGARQQRLYRTVTSFFTAGWKLICSGLTALVFVSLLTECSVELLWSESISSLVWDVEVCSLEPDILHSWDAISEVEKTFCMVTVMNWFFHNHYETPMWNGSLQQIIRLLRVQNSSVVWDNTISFCFFSSMPFMQLALDND